MESIRGSRVQEWTEEQLGEHFARLVQEAEVHEDSGSQDPFPKKQVMVAIERERLQRTFDRNPKRFGGVVPKWMANFGVTA